MDARQFSDAMNAYINNQILGNYFPQRPISIEDVETLVTLRQHLQRFNEIGGELTVENTKELVQLLENRWLKIAKHRKTPIIPSNSADDICMLLADFLAQIHKKNRFLLLMPTITVTYNEISATDLNTENLFSLNYILSDDNDRIIEVLACLDFAIVDGVLKHTSLFDGQPKKLSDAEAARVINYCSETREFYKAIQARQNVTNKGESLGALLNGLIQDLRRGGATNNPLAEFNAGRNANEGINYFSQWFEILSAEDKQALFSAKPQEGENFEILWNRLARPTDVDYEDIHYCVEIIAGKIENILENNKWLYDYCPIATQQTYQLSISYYDEKIKSAREALENAFQNSLYFQEPPLSWQKYLLNNYVRADDLQHLISSTEKAFADFNSKSNLLYTILLHCFRIYDVIPSAKNSQILDLVDYLIVELYEDYPNLINTYADMLRIFSELPNQFQIELFSRLQFKIQHLITSSDQILPLVDCMEPDARLDTLVTLFETFPWVVTTPFLAASMTHLKTEEQIPFLKNLMELHLISRENLLLVLPTLPQLDRFIFTQHLINTCPDLIVDAECLVALLAAAPLQRSILEYAAPYLKEILDTEDKRTTIFFMLNSEKDKLFLREKLGFVPPISSTYGGFFSGTNFVSNNNSLVDTSPTVSPRCTIL